MLADLAQDLVARCVAVAGVDHLEVVQVQVQQAGLVLAQHLLQVFLEGGAVVQAGQQVVALLPLQHAHVVLLLRDIVQHHHGAGIFTIQRGGADVDGHVSARGAADPVHAVVPAWGHSRLFGACQVFDQHLGGKRQDGLDVLAQQMALRQVQQPRCGGVGVTDAVLLVQVQHAVAQGGQGAAAALALGLQLAAGFAVFDNRFLDGEPVHGAQQGGGEDVYKDQQPFQIAGIAGQRCVEFFGQRDHGGADVVDFFVPGRNRLVCHRAPRVAVVVDVLAQLVQCLHIGIAAAPGRQRRGQHVQGPDPGQGVQQRVDVVGVVFALQQAGANARAVAVAFVQRFTRLADTQRCRQCILESQKILGIASSCVLVEVQGCRVESFAPQALATHHDAHRGHQHDADAGHQQLDANSGDKEPASPGVGFAARGLAWHQAYSSQWKARDARRPLPA
ncbi:hypothetical protein N7340_15130 [Comamonas aquatica]|nr:hypothetical protein [Comamonas aquatica]MDH0373091.1 hypothetical protein [Comamonas aquatica]